MDTQPNPTLYIQNLDSSISKDGEMTLLLKLSPSRALH